MLSCSFSPSIIINRYPCFIEIPNQSWLKHKLIVIMNPKTKSYTIRNFLHQICRYLLQKEGRKIIKNRIKLSKKCENILCRKLDSFRVNSDKNGSKSYYLKVLKLVDHLHRNLFICKTHKLLYLKLILSILIFLNFPFHHNYLVISSLQHNVCKIKL